MWKMSTSDLRSFHGKGRFRYDPALPQPANALRLRWWLERASRRWSDHLPGGATRRLRRLRRRFLAFGEPAAQAALTAYERGTITDFDDLRLIAQLMAQSGDMEGYEALLHAYDGALVLSDAPRKAFFGEGGGIGVMNVYRRLDTPDETRFEKIYQRSGVRRPGNALARSIFAREVVLARYPVIDAPALRARRDGERLTVLEFEFVDFQPLQPDLIEKVVPVVRRLAAMDVAPFGATHQQFSRPYNFPGWSRRIENRLRARDPALAAGWLRDHAGWLAQIERHPLVFSHGDLNFENVSASGMVVDWDNAGFRHYGFDAAYPLRRLRFNDADALLAFCDAHYTRPASAARDRFAFAFFFFWMMPARKSQWDNLPLFDTLLARLPELAAAAE